MGKWDKLYPQKNVNQVHQRNWSSVEWSCSHAFWIYLWKSLSFALFTWVSIFKYSVNQYLINQSVIGSASLEPWKYLLAVLKHRNYINIKNNAWKIFYYFLKFLFFFLLTANWDNHRALVNTESILIQSLRFLVFYLGC